MCMGARAYTELTSAASGILGDLDSNSIGYIGGRNTLRWRTETYSGPKDGQGRHVEISANQGMVPRFAGK